MFNLKCCNNSKLRFQNPEAICLAPKWAQRALGGCLFKQSVNGYCDDGAWCYCEDVVSGAVEDQLTSGKSWSHTFWHLLLWCCECSYSGGWRTIAKFGGELVTHFGDECDNGVNCECYWRGSTMLCLLQCFCIMLRGLSRRMIILLWWRCFANLLIFLCADDWTIVPSPLELD